MAVAALLLGLVGALLWTLALLSAFPELVRNEMLLAFWPTDLLLPWLSARWQWRYAFARLLLLVLMLVGKFAGVLVQPMVPAAMVLLPMAVIVAVSSRSRR
jgi:hypothetical protein